MQYFFLAADKPIVKSYELDVDKKLIKHPYPFVYEVTSHEEPLVSDLPRFTELLKRHAAKGHCLLKGKLARPLRTESRAGSTDRDQTTDWICLDLDGVKGFTSLDEFLRTIGLGDIDYTVQWSSSMGIELNTGFRCHVFMRLDKPTHPQILKQWLMDLNLRHLKHELELTKTGNSLRWPLDVTTCQNDKLLYIAPPHFGRGLSDPLAGQERIAYNQRAYRVAQLPGSVPDMASLKEEADLRVNEIRTRLGMPKRPKAKYKYAGAVEYLTNPAEAIITSQKTERGFTYLNLNGGDSWAYYHPDDNPTFVYNFKGEPVYRTEDLLPGYWASLQQKARSFAPNSQGQIYLAFRDLRSANYYNGWFNQSTGDLVIHQAKNETQLKHFMKQHGQVLGDFVPDWNLTWEPSNPNVIDLQAKTINTYEPSTLVPRNSPTVPPTISKIVNHVLGGDAASIAHFYNWLACILQYKDRTGSAWVWQGTQGTGKGVLFHQILTPLLGSPNVVSKRMEELESEFTGFMENKLVVFIDEIEAGKSLYHDKVTSKLKNLIVEPTISIRKMYHPAYMAPNFSSMIFASNKPAPVEVSPDDRRFNVGPYQTLPIQLTSTEVDDDIPKELALFAGFLLQYPADRDLARKPLISSARATLIDIGRTAIDSLADAILDGNIGFLWDHLSSATAAKSMTMLQQIKYNPFRELVIDIVQNQTTKLTRDDLFVILDWCIGGIPSSPHKFTSYLKHHRIHLTQIWKNNRNVRGIDVLKWVADPVWLASIQAEIANGHV